MRIRVARRGRTMDTSKHFQASLGFTLIEAIVSVAVFAMTLTAVVGSFLAVLRIDQKGRAARTVEQNARFISEYLTREIRNGYINYGTSPLNYSGSSVPQSVASDLRLINNAGEHTRVYLSNGVLYLEKNGIGTTNLSGQDVTISNLGFYIYPAQDPYNGGGTAVHPRVTFVFTITSNTTTRTIDQSRITIESSVSSRDFPL